MKACYKQKFKQKSNKNKKYLLIGFILLYEYQNDRKNEKSMSND
jgi:hypothetical protein